MTASLRRRVGRLFAAAFLVVLCAPVSAAASGDATLSGAVAGADGKPIAGAAVLLRGIGGDRSATSNAAGQFSIAGLDIGSYAIVVSAARFNTLRDRVIGVTAREQRVRLTLVRSSSSLVTIGRVQTSGGDALSTSSVPTTQIDTQQYSDDGYTRISDVLFDDPSTTLVHPLAGGSNLPTSVALRGPDPTETLVDVDGHQINNGNTGDFDLSLLDPADYSGIELVKGISPSALVGPDTIDGAINIRTLEPTSDPHGAIRFSAGSFNSFAETLESTGTYDRLGYVLSLHRTTSAGEVNAPIFDLTTNAPATVGSAFDASTALAKLRYSFGRGGDSYAEFSFHDQSQFRDLSAELSSVDGSAPPGSASSDSVARRLLDDSVAGPIDSNGLQDVFGEEGSTLQTHNTGYGLDLRVPLDDVEGVSHTNAVYRHYSSDVDESVTGPATDSSPYLNNSRDLIGDDTLGIDHEFSNSSLTLQYEIRNETLKTDFIPGVVNEEAVARALPTGESSLQAIAASETVLPGVEVIGLAQTQRSAVLRYTYDPTSQLHLTAAAYYSDYSIFGTSTDPRFGLAYDPDSRTVARFSVGTTYQAPQLPELLVPPVLPQPVGGYIQIGNPNLKPDRATEYGLGVSHIFENGAHRTDASVDVYRVNLRQPATPTTPVLTDPNCGAKSLGGDGTTCPISEPINAGDGIYQGIELAASRRIASDTTVRAAYAVRSAVVTKVPSIIQDGTLVPYEQDLGLPLQKWNVSLRRTPPIGFTFDGDIVYEGLYNELNRPQFAVINAGFGYRFASYEVGVFGTNLTNVFDQRFTQQNEGQLYGSVGSIIPPISNDAYVLQGAAFTLTLAKRF